jgi:hypothetical protein
MMRRAAIATAALATALIAVVPLIGHTASAAAGPAVTVSGSGEFANLKITVSQTTGLINQVVTVSWTGGTPTKSAADFSTDYLQIMQCWGDDAGGPRREQCQYGGRWGTPSADTRGGIWAASRQVSYGSSLVDPEETYLAPGDGSDAYVPFQSATGKTDTGGNNNEFFDSNTTNEVEFARTRGDGTGEAFFEVQTVAEAPGLGCGAVMANGQPRSCWLVIVPRAETEVNGVPASQSTSHMLDSSALSQSNWDHHIAVKLSFQKAAGACPIGASQRLIEGEEEITEAIGRWQPTLCSNGGTIYGFTQVTDERARISLVSGDPTMVFLNRPVASADPSLVYAPVALSGLVVAFDIEAQTPADAPDSVKADDGRRFTDLKLNARLLAKLLTQSYRYAVNANAPDVAANPTDMMQDPEFQQLNPQFADETIHISDALVPIITADSITELWAWIDADADAHAFMIGETDPWGMKINPNYVNQSPTINSFPKSDPYCATIANVGGLPFCTNDAHPYALDFHDAGHSAARGDSLVHSGVTLGGANGNTPVGWKKGNLQVSGQRALLAITDAATAARFGLPVAKLRNASGHYVAPDNAGLLAGAAAMKPGTTGGVLTPDPTSTAPGAYPLTTITYAAANPASLNAKAGKDYATFLRYAVGAGQTPGIDPGQLPAGYAPLPAALCAKTLLAATTIQTKAGVKPKPTSTRTTATQPPRGSTPTTPATTIPISSEPLPSPSPSAPGLAVVRFASAEPVGGTRYTVVVVLLFGLLAAVVGQVLRIRTGRRSKRRTLDVPEVMPAEQKL